jgi:phosphoesterase RecJ-like protein
MKEALTQAAEAIRSANRIVLAGHINPDGDTLGSNLALTHALRAMGKTAIPLSHDGVPDIYRWMPGQEWVLRDTEERDFDLAIVCDTGTADRIGRARAAIESAPASINIDHHVAEGEFGQIRVVNTKASATGELIFALLQELGAEITPEIAQCLMCAIVTDTGSFKYMNVTPTTFHIAGELMSAGASPAVISELVFENRTYGSVKLLGRALDSLQMAADGQVAWAHVRAEDFQELNTTDEETEGIVNHVRAIKTAQVGVLFREIPGKKVRISLRSRDGYDVNKVARVFGGGGHHLAAGCSMDPPLAEAEKLVIAEVIRQLGDQ